MLKRAPSGHSIASQKVIGDSGKSIFDLVDELSAEIKRDLPLPVDEGVRDRERLFQSAYPDMAAEELGFAPQAERGGGGSDANIFNECGIPSVIIATGPADVHTVNESVDAQVMVESAHWLTQILGLVVADASR